MRSTPILALRALLFYSGYALLTIAFSITGKLLFGRSPLATRSRFILGWNRCTIAWARWTCGLRYQIHGAENLPAAPYVALAKHQSQWETYFLQRYLAPVCIVLKQELLNIPVFGWGLSLTDPVPIDRSNPRQAMRQTQEQGLDRLDRGISMLIFPEGTRIPPGQMGKFARSGAHLAEARNLPIVPIAHNAGEFWPADKFLKYPGTIQVVIGQPIWPEGRDSRELTEEVQRWMEHSMAELAKRN